jgi:tRNA-dihydrouridine synthase
MGCPDKNIVKRGAGAALIMQPTKARAIIRAVKKAINDFSTNGDKKSYFREEILFWLKNYACFSQPNRLTNKISLSIKTRLAPTKHTHDEWLKNLLAEEPDLIIIHGRTVAQLYGGKVNWEAIGKAVKLAGKGVSKIIGNGDIRSRQEAQEKIKQYQLAGVLIGRAALGNPWVFRDYSPSLTEKIAVMLEHCRQFKRLTPELNFLSLRKHLLWYLKGFKNGHSLKKKLAQATSINQVEEIIKQEYF